MILTRGWSDYRERLRAIRLASKSASNLVDTHPLDTAQQVAPLAVTHIEQDYATQALRLADHSVDLAFSAAMHDAAENPAPLTPEMRDLAARVKSRHRSGRRRPGPHRRFHRAMAQAKGGAKDDLQTLIGIAQAQLALDQDDLEDAQQDLIRSGGDRQATIQQLLDQRKAAEPAKRNSPSRSSRGIGAVDRAHSVQKYRRGISRLDVAARERKAVASSAGGCAGARGETFRHARDAREATERRRVRQLAALADGSQAAPESDTPLSHLRQQTEDKKNLSDFDKRIQTEQQLAAVYSSWADLVNARAKGFLHQIFVSIFWVILIGCARAGR